LRTVVSVAEKDGEAEKRESRHMMRGIVGLMFFTWLDATS
jgi:tellurite resistance protein